jgi:MFS family permease
VSTLTPASAEAPPFRRDRRVQVWAVTAGLSQVGDLAWMVALAWTATRIGGPAEAGLVIGAGTAPRAVVMLFGGALADRFDARRTMVLANLGRILVMLLGAVAVAVQGPSIAVLLVVAVCFGVLDAFYEPASSTLPRQMVRVEDLPAMAALFQVTGRVAAFVGAPLGGVLVGSFGLVAVMVVNAASFTAISLFVVTALRPRFPVPRSTSQSVLRDLAAIAAYLQQDRPVRTMVVAFSGLNLFVGPALAVGLALTVHEASWSATSLGVFQACVGLGAAAGALASLVLSRRFAGVQPARHAPGCTC